MQTVLEVVNATKVYRRKGGSVICAALNVNFSVNEGEVVGFLGPNGAGKSTVIKMITGLASPTSGEIFISGKSILKNRRDAMKYVGGVIENPDMYTEWSGQKNLEYYASLHDRDTMEKTPSGFPRKEVDERRIAEVLNIVGMTDRKDDAVRKYSLGMKQRLGIAQALLNTPRLLVLDEPANGLDPAGIKDMRDLLKKLAHEFNMAVLVSSHQLAEMQLMCDRIIIIKNGEIIAEKGINQLGSAEGNMQVTLFTDSPAEVTALLDEKFGIKASINVNKLEFSTSMQTNEITREIVLAGYNVYSIQTKEASLEDIFMDLTAGGKR